MKYLISGGGTGGHIFPAVSIANALREADPNCEILFVGALGRMEMERVPQAGYKIIGLPVKGFDGGRSFSCLLLSKFSPRTVATILDTTSFFCIFILWSASVYFIMRAGAYLSLFVFSASLFARMFLPDAPR